MKLCIKGPSGMYHALDVSEEVLIHELKSELAKVEDIPPELQIIRFAGQELQDFVPVGDYTILEYSLQEEVLLYLEQKFAEPMIVYIKWPANANNIITEQVEERSTVDDIMQIMINLQVVAAWAETADVVVKRMTGSTIKNLGIQRSHTVREAQDIISNAQGFPVKQMTFMEGFDGHLHITVVPSEEPEDVLTGNTLTYSLKSKQPVMPKKNASTGVPFQSLTRDHCLMDRSTDYDPHHTWLPPSMRRTCPWPTTGPKKPDP
mmetsp:Transcript_24576/g.68422  ORF Transcript_24576/g.68422 Transcript_24576/m.68422 type:complete len:262 (+) Transcript_24576:257-1042(+)